MKGNRMREVRVLPRGDYGTLYETYMRKDFASNELKPLAAMLALYDRGIYEGYGLFEGSELLGYAFLTMGETACGLVDYLAVRAEFRNTGLGSEFLTLLAERLAVDQTAPGGLLLESERPSAGETEEDRALRQRRLGFYERNGFRLTGLKCLLFGVDFCILHRAGREGAFDDRRVYEELSRVYGEMGYWRFRDKVILRESAEE